MHCRYVLWALFASAQLAMPASASGSVLGDDFEDGDWTDDPTWTGAESFYSVTPDPIDPGNLGLQGMGTDTAHKNLLTFFDGADPIPWENFSFSIDLMSTVDSGSLHAKPYIEFGDGSNAGSYSYLQRIDNGRIYGELVGHPTGPPKGADIFEDAGQSEPFIWYRISLWHDAASDPDHIQFRMELPFDGTVVSEGTSDLMDPFSNSAGISWVSLWTEEEVPYYYDNLVIQTIPEPGTAMVLLLGVLAARGSRARHRS